MASSRWFLARSPSRTIHRRSRRSCGVELLRGLLLGLAHPLRRVEAGLDPLGELDLLLGVEQRHLADLLQVGPDRVGGRGELGVLAGLPQRLGLLFVPDEVAVLAALLGVLLLDSPRPSPRRRRPRARRPRDPRGQGSRGRAPRRHPARRRPRRPSWSRRPWSSSGRQRLAAVLRGARGFAAPAVFFVAVFKLGFSVVSSVSGWARPTWPRPPERWSVGLRFVRLPRTPFRCSSRATPDIGMPGLPEFGESPRRPRPRALFHCNDETSAARLRTAISRWFRSMS